MKLYVFFLFLVYQWYTILVVMVYHFSTTWFSLTPIFVQSHEMVLHGIPLVLLGICLVYYSVKNEKKIGEGHRSSLLFSRFAFFCTNGSTWYTIGIPLVVLGIPIVLFRLHVGIPLVCLFYHC